MSGRFEWSPGRVGPVVELLPDGTNVAVTEPFTYYDSYGNAWSVPVGTISDGASIPRPLWSTLGAPLTGKYRAAALIHDFIYRSQSATRDVADQVLLDAMHACGVEDVLARTIFEGVHLAGGVSYENDAILHAKATASS